MAYLFKFKLPKCGEDACHLFGKYEVRSSLLFDKERFPKLPEPRCMRHAKRLYAWFETQEAAQRPADQKAGNV